MLSSGAEPEEPVTEGRASKRDELLDAADRVVQREGSAASMNLIAAEAGITKPILYRHFGDKVGLYRALADRHIDELLARLRAALTTRGGLQARTRATVDAYLAAVEEEPQVYRFLVERAAVEEPDVRGQVQGFVRRFGEELAAGIANEPQLQGLDPQRALVWAHAIAGMVQATGDWWLDHPDVAREVVVDQLTAFLWQGFAGFDGRPQQ
ncbi:MAG TPA: TetR/AcrR family transcriptional regulator [Mycobacteriales bacterium]|nr:TetR/AcrR family transcriptional regulator [Mycobacteriales bacterium]